MQTNNRHLIELLVLKNNTGNLLPVYKQMNSGSLKNPITRNQFVYNYIYIYICVCVYIYIYIYIYIEREREREDACVCVCIPVCINRIYLM